MADIIQSITQSLDGTDTDLFPYFSYLLQDIYEIGSSPDVIVNLLVRNGVKPGRALDLGCGKGAVATALVCRLGCFAHGIDALPAFIEEAWRINMRNGLLSQLQFEVGDIRERVKSLSGFDLAVLGSIGPVLGTIEETLRTVSPCLNSMGWVVLDDGYLPDIADHGKVEFVRHSEAEAMIHRAGFRIVDAFLWDPHEIKASDDLIYASIETRAFELMEAHPEKEALFQSYLDAQLAENRVLEEEIVCVTWLLQKH